MLIRFLAVSVLVVGLVVTAGCIGGSKPKNNTDDKFAEKSEKNNTISKKAAEIKSGKKKITEMDLDEAKQLIALPGAGGDKDRRERDDE